MDESSLHGWCHALLVPDSSVANPVTSKCRKPSIIPGKTLTHIPLHMTMKVTYQPRCVHGWLDTRLLVPPGWKLHGIRAHVQHNMWCCRPWISCTSCIFAWLSCSSLLLSLLNMVCLLLSSHLHCGHAPCQSTRACTAPLNSNGCLA